MEKALLFLNGSYPQTELNFYRQAIEQSLPAMVVAVDGALNFFAKINRQPDLIIGDFDSVDTNILSKFEEVERVTYPQEKDATDGELALRYLLDKGYIKIDIFGAIDTNFETDQMLANIFGLALITEKSKQTDYVANVRLVDHKQHIYLVVDNILELTGKENDLLSVLPLPPAISLSIKGAKWELRQSEVRFGSSWPLRNRFTGSKVTLQVKGTAIVIHRYS